MNYLAHLFLAEDNAESRIGNLLGDFVKGPLENYKTRYSENILKGIRTHRKVDRFTDTHSIYRKSKHRLSQIHCHFSGIIIDIFYDHFLAKNWLDFSPEPLEKFANNIYTVLENNRDILPEKLQNSLTRMSLENWLVVYREIEGINLTLQRLSRRIKRANHLVIAQDELRKNYAEIESDFLNFFPEIINYVETNRSYF
jgi:acyl carrier protein phosphodiesterase